VARVVRDQSVSNLDELLDQATRLHQSGQLALAEQQYARILALDPANPAALRQAGALALHMGRIAAALELLQRAAQVDRTNADTWLHLGEARRHAGLRPAAVEAYQRAIKLQPALVAAHAFLGSVHVELGQLEAAIECLRQAAKLSPDEPQIRALLGAALSMAGRLADAEACFRRLTLLTPQNAQAHYNLGATLQSQGKLAEAEACYQQALALVPTDARTLNNLGAVRQQLADLQGAEQLYRQAITVEPRFASAHSNLGALLIETFRHDEAVEHCRLAAQYHPQAADALGNLANALANLGQLDEAVATYRQALAVAPYHAKLHGDLLYLLNFCPQEDSQSLFREHRAWGGRHADPITARSSPPARNRHGDRRLRVGYVSPYFLNHAVNFFVEPILQSHDHEHFEIHCFSDARTGDEATARLRAAADHWHETQTLSDTQLAQRVREARIDILVDLTGHIGGSRLLAFAERPAPVQVTYIGYQNTTGMRAMDYRVTDDYSDPPGTTDALHTERLVRLSGSFFCYLPSGDAPPVAALPARARGRVTFGSFNNFQKLNATVLETWAELLLRVPESRLMIIVGHGVAGHDALRRRFALCGIDSERLELVPRLSRAEYLQGMSTVDIALDPFPFNGHTTTCDCLWQGVPVLTLSGDSYRSRFGGSGLHTLGLHEWIATGRQQYVEIGARQALDIAGLSTLRHELRARMAASPLLDHSGFTRRLEAAYRQMWSERCDG